MLTDREKANRMEQLVNELNSLGREMLELVAPTPEEIKALAEDTEVNPEIYMSYLIDDPIFIAENVWQEREAKENDNG